MVGFGCSLRGQSEALGAVLVLAVVLIGISALVVGGGQTLSSSGQAVHVEQTQEALVELSANVESITHGSSDNQEAQVNLDTGDNQGEVRVDESAGHLTLDVGGSTVYDDSLGAVVYESGETTLAYQGGGVWRHDGDGSTMVNAPGFSERGSGPVTLTMPIIQVTGSSSLNHQMSASQQGMTELYPSIQVGVSDPINIRIESQFADAWGTYFVEKLGVDDGDVTVSGDGTVVEIEYAQSSEGFFHTTHYQVRLSDG